MTDEFKDACEHLETNLKQHLDNKLNPLIKIVEDHETILRGRNRRSGIIKEINIIWTMGVSGAIGFLWKVWDYINSTK